MPTTNIIGYLWHNRQALDIDGLPDVLQMVADLQRHGLECVQVKDIEIMGAYVTTNTWLVEREDSEWAWRVEDAIVTSAVEHALDMLHEDGDPE